VQPAEKEKNMRRKLAVLFCLAMLGLLFPGCPQVTPNPGDSTPPQVEIKVKINNQYVPKSTFDSHQSDEPIDLMCLVTDPEGVRSLDLSFTGGTSSHCTVGSTVFNGSFPVSLPGPLHQDLQGNSSGQVLTKLPMFADLGPFTCKPLGQPEGRPIGHTVTAVCVGKNWSQVAGNSSTQAKLDINIK
jgi:hypothetical protein